MKSNFSSLIPLADLPYGERAVLVDYKPGKGFASRLACFGFTPGAVIEMIQNYGRGPLVVIVRGNRVALGRQEASKIVVKRSAQ